MKINLLNKLIEKSLSKIRIINAKILPSVKKKGVPPQQPRSFLDQPYGNIDLIDYETGEVHGWAALKNKGYWETGEFKIKFNSIQYNIDNSVFRPDLKKFGIGDGRFAFTLVLPYDQRMESEQNLLLKYKNQTISRKKSDGFKNKTLPVENWTRKNNTLKIAKVLISKKSLNSDTIQLVDHLYKPTKTLQNTKYLTHFSKVETLTALLSSKKLIDYEKIEIDFNQKGKYQINNKYLSAQVDDLFSTTLGEYCQANLPNYNRIIEEIGINDVLVEIPRRIESINSICVHGLVWNEANISFSGDTEKSIYNIFILSEILSLAFRIIPNENKLEEKSIFAFFLPQYHETLENNHFWGAGFTEWTNLAGSKKQFEKHAQPKIPSELGFYDLIRDYDIMYRQERLAKLYGIAAFSYYYYNFEHDEVLKAPLDQKFQRKDLVMNYFITWANEHWSRTWDGRDREVILRQTYDHKTLKRLIKTLKKHMSDDRYVKINGEPILMIYRFDEVPDKFIRELKETLNNAGIKIKVMPIRTNFEKQTGSRTSQIDKGVFFPPHKATQESLKIENASSFKGQVYDWDNLICDGIDEIINSQRKYETYCSMMNWDNTPRRGDRAIVFKGATPIKFSILNYINLIRSESGLAGINAWNEWCEGTVLEPTVGEGRSYLMATKLALEEFNSKKKTDIIVFGHAAGKQIYGGERSLLDSISYLNALNVDMIVFLPEPDNRDYVLQIEANKNAKVLKVRYPRGREFVNTGIDRIVSLLKPNKIYQNTTVIFPKLDRAKLPNSLEWITHAREIPKTDEELHFSYGLNERRWLSALSQTDIIIANSVFTSKYWSEIFFTKVIYNKTPEITDIGQRSDIRSIVNLVFSSSNTRKKGVYDIVKISSELSRIGVNHSIDIYGGKTTDLEECLNLVNRMGFPIKYCGYYTDITCLVGKYDAGLSLSYFDETWGRSVVELSVITKVTFAYSGGALNELDDYFPIIYSERGDYKDLAAKISKWVSGNLKPNTAMPRPLGAANISRYQSTFCQQEAKVDLIVPVYNAYEHLQRLLDSISKARSYFDKVIVIDDGSSDPNIINEISQRSYSLDLTFFRNKENQGYTRTVNKGILASKKDVIVCNTDVVFNSSVYKNFIHHALELPHCGTASPLSNNAGPYSLILNNKLDFHVDHILNTFNRKLEHLNTPPFETPVTHGFFLFMSRKCINEIGLFDESAFQSGYGTENDFCMRATAGGFKNYVIPTSFVFHEGNASFGSNRKKNYLSTSQRTLLAKYPEIFNKYSDFFESKAFKKIIKNCSDAVT